MPRRTTPSKPRRRRSNPLEFFETPPGFTRFLLQHVSLDGTIFMPCVGDGAILRVMRQQEPPSTPRTYITNDIDPARAADHHFDARVITEWWKRFDLGNPAAITHGLGEIDWVVDNPPFSAAYQILIAALNFAKVGVALHLRISFEEPTLEREDFITKHPADGRLILPRYRFDPTKIGTDSVCTAWLIWLRTPERMYHPLGGGPFSTRLWAKRTLVAPRSVIEERMEPTDGKEDLVVPATS